MSNSNSKKDAKGEADNKDSADNTDKAKSVSETPPKEEEPTDSKPADVVIAQFPDPPKPVPVPESSYERVEPNPTQKTTNALAYILILSFFVIAAAPLIVIFAAGGDTMVTKTNTAIEWLKGVSAYLAGLIGAVIGYYFRSQTAEK